MDKSHEYKSFCREIIVFYPDFVHYGYQTHYVNIEINKTLCDI